MSVLRSTQISWNSFFCNSNDIFFFGLYFKHPNIFCLGICLRKFPKSHKPLLNECVRFFLVFLFLLCLCVCLLASNHPVSHCFKFCFFCCCDLSSGQLHKLYKSHTFPLEILFFLLFVFFLNFSPFCGVIIHWH